MNTVGDLKALYEVTVTETAKGKIVQKLKTFIGDIEGLEIKIKGGEVVIEGKIIVADDLGRMYTILSRSEFKDVITLVEVHPQSQILIARKMQDEIRKQGLKNVSVRLVNGVYWLEGVVSSGAEKTRAEEISLAYFPATLEPVAQRERLVKVLKKDIIQNFITVNKKSSPPSIPKLIKISTQFVELSKDYNKVFAFKWVPLMNGNGGEISIGKTASGESALNQVIHCLRQYQTYFQNLASAKSAGHARVIQSGVIITEEKKASLQKNIKQPFAIGTGEFTQARTANSNFSINVKPQSLPKEKIKIQIGVSVSSAVGRSHR